MKYNKINDITPREWDSVSKYKRDPHHKNDMVNHPPHYNKGDIECIDGIKAMLSEQEYIGYLRGNSLKYRWRFPYKNGTEDIFKAEWYENKLKEILLERKTNT